MPEQKATVSDPNAAFFSHGVAVSRIDASPALAFERVETRSNSHCSSGEVFPATPSAKPGAILSGWPLPTCMTDEWGHLLDALEKVRAFARSELTEDVARAVEDLIHEVQLEIHRRLGT